MEIFNTNWIFGNRSGIQRFSHVAVELVDADNIRFDDYLFLAGFRAVDTLSDIFRPYRLEESC